MRKQLSLSVLVVSLAAAFAACSSSPSTGDDDDDDVSSSSSGTTNTSSGGHTASSGGASSGGNGTSSGNASSSGEPIPPGKPGAACEGADDCDDHVCRAQVCVAPTANDGVKNGNESDVDCGRSGAGTDTSAPLCTTNGVCAAPTDCASFNCVQNACVAPTSGDGIKNGNETDIDCGESAPGPDTDAPTCADERTCGVAADCQSGVCTDGVCRVPTATDLVKNGNETDIDCGSAPLSDGVVDTGAGPCRDLATCLADDDCSSFVCAELICQAPTCVDTAKNGNETDLNCGGGACIPCAVGKSCEQGARDCDSGL